MIEKVASGEITSLSFGRQQNEICTELHTWA